MAKRIYLDITANDFSELAIELRRLADFADQSSKILSENKDTFNSDGMKNVLDGLDSTARVLQKMHGLFNVPLPSLTRLRVLISEEKQKQNDADPLQIAAKVREDASAIAKEQQPLRNLKTLPLQELKPPRTQRTKKRPEKK